jgi:hypothetical protein
VINQNLKSKLYFDMGEQGGWMPFRAGAKTGRPGVLKELTQVCKNILASIFNECEL